MRPRRDSKGRFAGSSGGTQGKLKAKKYAKRTAIVAGLGATAYAGVYAHHYAKNSMKYNTMWKTSPHIGSGKKARGIYRNMKKTMHTQRMSFAFQRAGYRQKPFVQGYAQFRTRKMGSFVHQQMSNPLTGKVTLHSAVRYHQQNVMPRGAEHRIFRGTTKGLPRQAVKIMKPQMVKRLRQEYGAQTRLLSQQRAQHRRLVMRYPVRSYKQRRK